MALEPRKVAEVRQLCHPCAGAMLCEAHPSTPQTLAFQQLYTLEVRVLHESHSPPPHFEVQLPKKLLAQQHRKKLQKHSPGLPRDLTPAAISAQFLFGRRKAISKLKISQDWLSMSASLLTGEFLIPQDCTPQYSTKNKS